MVADALTDADERGLPSHGCHLLPMCVQRLRAGSVRPHARAEVIVDAGAVAVLDAGHAFGILTGDQAMALAVEKARRLGVGAVAVRHAFHFGIAARYAMAAASEGCIGVALANTRPLMPAPGGASAVVGNNPLAIAAGEDRLVLDMAMSEAALGKIRLAAAEGRSIPATWATDADGRPTTDPDAALDGLLLPTGGAKGYGLALAVEVLTGVLSGGAFGAAVRGLYADLTVPNDCAHFFLALDPAAFGASEGFAERLDALCSEVTGGPTAPGVDRLLVPGERERDHAASAAAEGVALDAATLAALHRTAADLGLDLMAAA